MPQRFLRPGITTSDRWNAASWTAQSFYIRLLTQVDDHGRFDGRVAVLQSYCFPLRSDVTKQKVQSLVAELEECGLIERYETPDHKEFVQVTQWHERARNKSKFADLNQCRLLTAAESCRKLPPSPLNQVTSNQVIKSHSSNGSQANTSEPSDEEWIAELSKSKAYQGIDVPREFSKMEQWCKTARKNPSRRRFINWLNKCERPIRTDRNAKPLDPSKIELPTEFREWAKGKYPTKEAELTGYKTWADVPDWMRVEWKREKIQPLTRTIAA